jgi:hypothetical protein
LILGEPSVIVGRIWILLFLKQSSKIRCLRRGLLENYGHAAQELGRIYEPSIVFDRRIGISIPGQNSLAGFGGTNCAVLLRKDRGRCENQQERDGTSYSYEPICLQLLPSAAPMPPILRIGSGGTNPHKEIT